MATTFGANFVTFNDGSVQDKSTNLYALGVESYWQNKTSERALATTYTNSTGSPIMVMVYNNFSASNALVMRIDSSGVSNDFGLGYNGDAVGAPGFSIIVPIGATYSLPYTYWSFAQWWELRIGFTI